MNEHSRFTDILTGHARRYPVWQLPDLYKLIHQASMGSEHALPDESGAREWLAREIESLDPIVNEPLVDPISEDGRIVRVHLRPYITQGYSPEDLLVAFIRTAREYHGSIDMLKSYWQAASNLADNGMIPFTRQVMDHFFAERSEQSFPAMHHSAIFEATYQPAYRVIAIDYFPGRLADPAR